MLLRLLALCSLLALPAAAPNINYVLVGGGTNDDRVPGVGDTLRVVFNNFPNWLDPSQTNFPEKLAVPPVDTELSKAEVDALLTFSVSLGADYSAERSYAGDGDVITVTLIDAAGADMPQLVALNFTVSCVPNQLYFEGFSSADACAADAVSNVVGQASPWGRGRPHIEQVLSLTDHPDKVFAAGDRTLVVFDAPTDAGAASVGTTLDADSVLALLELSPAAGNLTGLWLDNRTLEITYHELGANSFAYATNEYSVGCVSNGGLRLELAAGEPTSAQCCDSSASAAACALVPATGTAHRRAHTTPS